MRQHTSFEWKVISPILVLMVLMAGFNPVSTQAQSAARPEVSFATRSDSTSALRDLPVRFWRVHNTGGKRRSRVHGCAYG